MSADVAESIRDVVEEQEGSRDVGLYLAGEAGCSVREAGNAFGVSKNTAARGRERIAGLREPLRQVNDPDDIEAVAGNAERLRVLMDEGLWRCERALSHRVPSGAGR